ncbi:MAG: hypothetical protein ABIZ91_01875 [Gemmatimonadaceae bacterium]
MAREITTALVAVGGPDATTGQQAKLVGVEVALIHVRAVDRQGTVVARLLSRDVEGETVVDERERRAAREPDRLHLREGLQPTHALLHKRPGARAIIAAHPEFWGEIGDPIAVESERIVRQTA